MASLRFGLVTPQLVPWPAMVERWRTAEDLGFDSVWVVDHFVNPYRPDGRWFEGWTMLAALAALTTRVRLGALVTSISFRNPAVLAKEALTVDHISNGRLELGIGAAGQERDHTMTGSEPWPVAERVARFGEAVQILDQMLRNEETTYEGRYYQVREALMNPGPMQRPRPPLTIAAHGPKTLRIAAAYADTWNSSANIGRSGPDVTVESAVEVTRQRNERMDELAAAQGRDPGAIRRSLLAGGGTTPENPWASVEAFQDFVGRYRAAGIDEFLFYYPSRAEQASGYFERIAHEVIPALREEGQAAVRG
jgi:alkanesulfonate monooxygenase SsuD/methylene tetrahydromethanopterin reductase-like flavin-dependent oxidoreductase (luciferase family)